MDGKWLAPAEYRRLREREERAARRRRDSEEHDPEMDSALIAWMAAGASMPWEEFRREWIQSRNPKP